MPKSQSPNKVNTEHSSRASRQLTPSIESSQTETAASMESTGGAFGAEHSRLHDRVFIQVSTRMGTVYLIRSESRDSFWSSASVGSAISWVEGRWDLYAIV